jgi:VWFA-related protein
VLVSGTANPQTAPQPAASTPSQQSFTASATAVLVDVVVRDKNGRPITDLAAGDFEIAEDGVRQTVESFTRVSRGGGIGVSVAWRSPATTIATVPSSTELSHGTEPDVEEGATAIVFDQLSPEPLRLAQNATLSYVPMNGRSAIRIGVFTTDPGIRLLQGFTADRSLVRRAVASVLPAGGSGAEQKAARADELLARRRSLSEQRDPTTGGASASTASLAQNASAIGVRESEMRLVQTELNMLRASEHLDREHRGYDTVLALLAVVRTLSAFPGRKTIVFFSEGLPASPVLSARLDAIIEAANRSNVTAYAVDAKGLRATSASANMRKEVDAFAEERFRQLAASVDRTDQPLTMEFERVEDMLRLDSRTGLSRLADETGGFLVEQTNDLSAALRRIDEDHRFHYLLTYAPKNTEFDGRFRTIQVKVRRQGAQVFARKGYRALPRLGVVDAAGVEAPALALLDRTPLPNAFPIHAAGFSFPDQLRPGLAPLLVRVHTSALRFAVDPQRSSYSGQASIVVRIRDEGGRTVQTLSQQYLLTGDAKDVAAASTGEILFYREPDLSPGVYAVESIVLDAVAQQASARVATLTIPPASSSAPGMSSLVLVSKIEDVSDPPTADPRTAPPLYVGRTLLYPHLGEPLRRTPTTELPFYFTLYNYTDAVTAHVQLSRNGRPMAEAPVDIPRSSGPRIQHVGRLPIGGLPAGTYELRIRVSDGRQELSRTAFFTVLD